MKYARALATTRASAAIVPPDVTDAPCAVVRSPEPYVSLARAVSVLAPPARPEPGAHPLAAVDPAAVVDATASIGAFAFIAFDNKSVNEDFTTVAIQIYNWTTRPQEAFRANAAAGIIVLMVMVIGLNLVAVLIRERFRRK